MKNVLVFPCGSEIALEIARSLEGDRHFHLVGATSVDDHGRFVYSDIVTGIPWIDSAEFVPAIKKVVTDKKIDLIYPATDRTIVVLKAAEAELGAYVVSAPLATADICLSKKKTYEALNGVVRLPIDYTTARNVLYPVFAKPEVGHSSKGTAVLRSEDEKNAFLRDHPDVLLLELLAGEEYTVDCFTDRHGHLLFAGARVRARTMNGISVRTCPVSQDDAKLFWDLAESINRKLLFRGAWFVQFKRNVRGELTLLEVAARFGGSSGLYRGIGVNFALLSLWDALDRDVKVLANDYPIEMDRALDNKYKLGITFDEVFLDYDDTIVMSADGTINPKVMQLVFHCINKNIKVTVLSRHRGDLRQELEDRQIKGLFSRIIHLNETDDKAQFIDNPNSVFVDDSYAERMRVASAKKIPVFGLDMIDALMEV